jgi:hypothetical protein
MARLVPLVLAVLAVIALGAAAATLTTTTPGAVTGDGEGTGVGSGPRFSLGGFNATEPPDSSILPPWVLRAFMTTIAVVGLIALVVYVYQEGLSGVAKLAMMALGIAALLGGLMWLLLNFDLGGDGESGILGGGDTTLPEGGGGSTADPSIFQEPAFLLFLVLGAILAGAIVVLMRTTDSGSPPPRTTSPPMADDSAQQVGAAAGRAADHIEGAGSVENAVFRAWREMTDHLDLPRRTTTPGEFADAAVEAGMRPDDVRELTALFEASRYGGVDPDEARERRAVDALRRIEREYAPDEPPTEFEQYDDVGRDAGAGAGGS